MVVSCHRPFFPGTLLLLLTILSLLPSIVIVLAFTALVLVPFWPLTLTSSYLLVLVRLFLFVCSFLSLLTSLVGLHLPVGFLVRA